MAWSGRNHQSFASEMARVSRSDQNQQECLLKFSVAPLSTLWRSVKTEDQPSVTRLASQTLCHCPLSPIYTLSNITWCPSTGLASAKHHVSQHHVTRRKTSTSPHLQKLWLKLSFKKILLHFLILSVCLWQGARTYHETHVEVRGQLDGSQFRLPTIWTGGWEVGGYP